MPDQVYEVISQAARYWFLFLMALIAWRSFRWLRRDRKQRKKRLRLLPDAGYVGELVVLRGNDELPAGLALPVSNEGILGCLRNDDVYVPLKGVAKKHLWYEFDEQFGLRVRPYRRHSVEVDGQTVIGWRNHADLNHGSQLTVGTAVLKLRLFAGFERAGMHSAAFSDLQEQPSVAQPTPIPQPTATFTPEQMAVIRQMQYDAAVQAYQAAQGQTTANASVLKTERGDFVPPPKMDDLHAGYPAELVNEPESEPEDGLPPARPPRASRLSRLSPLPPLAEASPGAARPADARGPAETAAPAFAPDDSFSDGESFAPDSRFYPPEPDVESETGEEPPEASGDDPEVGEALKSLYVEPDEAEKAKRLLWDKYLKGGRRP